MSLVHEATIKYAGFSPGDVKVAHYDIAFTLNQLVEPTNDLGWFLLNGAVVSQATYAFLFAKFGSVYNTGGEGAGNFRLPDLTEGRAPIAKGLGTFITLGASGGEINHLLTGAELPSHSHGNTLAWASNSHTHTATGAVDSPNHTHTTSASIINAEVNRGNSGSARTAVSNTFGNATASANPGHFHSGTLTVDANTSPVSSTGSPQSTLQLAGTTIAVGQTSHNNMQPYVVIGGWLVKYQ